MLPWFLNGILLIIIILIVIKNILLNKSLDQLCLDLKEHLSLDTNTLLTISNGDKHLRKIVIELNKELSSLRKLRHNYMTGNQELTDAITNISHDLRTPLTAISGYLDLLERENTSELVTSYLSYIKNRVYSMKDLTEELFRYSVITTSEELKKEPVDLVRVLEENLLSFYGTLSGRNIVPIIHLAEKPIIRELDVNALNRIFSNIISNAIKYSCGDFMITMDLDGTIHFTNATKDLTPVTVAKLFNRFYTVETSRNSTGLGLYIAKLLTERLGGKIEASLDDHAFTISLSF